MKLKKFKVYEYDIIDKDGDVYAGSYTIYEEVEPLHFKNERLVQQFEAPIPNRE